MRVLLDNNVPRGVARALTGHAVNEARERGWATMRNGELLRTAEEAGFDVLVTAGKNIRHQQNLASRRIALVALTQLRWGLGNAPAPTDFRRSKRSVAGEFCRSGDSGRRLSDDGR